MSEIQMNDRSINTNTLTLESIFQEYKYLKDCEELLDYIITYMFGSYSFNFKVSDKDRSLYNLDEIEYRVRLHMEKYKDFDNNE